VEACTYLFEEGADFPTRGRQILSREQGTESRGVAHGLTAPHLKNYMYLRLGYHYLFCLQVELQGGEVVPGRGAGDAGAAGCS
jgi:hypothetical protein